MGLVKRFVLVVVNMIGELWMGFYRRNSDYYDHQTSESKVRLAIMHLLLGQQLLR
ncbi:hypothetical protein MKY92_12565 [Paenibacillus sp. FSL R5-0623]|uniref:hypothetical protein n=1 Tax=Paenibacillus sp. FSL R5-0623 TaxID=2921651 RepID=UPI0030DB7E91